MHNKSHLNSITPELQPSTPDTQSGPGAQNIRRIDRRGNIMTLHDIITYKFNITQLIQKYLPYGRDNGFSQAQVFYYWRQFIG